MLVRNKCNDCGKLHILVYEQIYLRHRKKQIHRHYRLAFCIIHTHFLDAFACAFLSNVMMVIERGENEAAAFAVAMKLHSRICICIRIVTYTTPEVSYVWRKCAGKRDATADARRILPLLHANRECDVESRSLFRFNVAKYKRDDVDDSCSSTVVGSFVNWLQLSRIYGIAEVPRTFRTNREARQQHSVFAVPLDKNPSIFYAARLALQWRVKWRTTWVSAVIKRSAI